ncbi:unnamed protein product, partial [Pylaiella littoralis]
MRGASPEVGQATPQPDDNLRGTLTISQETTRAEDNSSIGRAGSPKGEGGKYDSPCSHDPQQLHHEAAKLIGCTGMGNQCK